MPEVYSPEEDSFLMSNALKEFLKKNKVKSILDLGSGQGIQAKTAIDCGINPENVFLLDIDPNAIKILKKKFPQSKVILSDLFSKIKGKFDLIVFNPPYLPENKYDSGIDTTGGKKGGEIINKFLSHAKKHIKEGGKILLLTSSLTKGIRWQDYSKKLVAKKRIFFEELYVYILSP